jgi:hypothetical protein
LTGNVVAKPIAQAGCGQESHSVIAWRGDFPKTGNGATLKSGWFSRVGFRFEKMGCNVLGAEKARELGIVAESGRQLSHEKTSLRRRQRIVSRVIHDLPAQALSNYGETFVVCFPQ